MNTKIESELATVKSLKAFSFEILYGGQFNGIINSVDRTDQNYIVTLTNAAPQFL